MRPVCATTGPAEVAEAGARALARGGNAVDAVAAAGLAWPPGLASAGVLLALGPGLGRVACRFPARVPGLGLSRPRRVRLYGASARAALVATPAAAAALSAAVARWGQLGLPGVTAAARTADAPHAALLALLAASGPVAMVKGPWAMAAARALGPVAGGLLTRRDLIEARADLGEAGLDPASGLALAGAAGAPSPADEGPGRRLLAAAALDGSGILAALALDAGADPGGEVDPALLGLPPNGLLAGQPAGTARRVGRALPLRCGCAGGLEGLPVILAGPAEALGWALRRSPADAFASLEAEDVEGLLILRGGARPAAAGAGATATP